MASPFEIYLVRHAVAAERGDAWPDDDQRPLTPRGIARFTEVVNGLVALGLELDEIFTSPLVRARQTAQLLAAGVGGSPKVKLLAGLSPGHAPAAVVAQMCRVAAGRRIALVGHESGLGELAGHLIGAGRALPFKKGGVCRVDIESLTRRRPGTLIWFATPKLLRTLA